jgi:hypothetical protein
VAIVERQEQLRQEVAQKETASPIQGVPPLPLSPSRPPAFTAGLDFNAFPVRGLAFAAAHLAPLESPAKPLPALLCAGRLRALLAGAIQVSMQAPGSSLNLIGPSKLGPNDAGSCSLHALQLVFLFGY